MEHSSSAIRAAIATAAKTKKLDLSFLQLTSIPASALKLKHLEELNLSNNLLEDIPSSISQLVSLKKFDISCNKLTHISDHIASCTALENLNLSNNLLSSIPNTISTLNKLKTINVYNNKLDIAEHITQTPAKLQAYLRIKLEEQEEHEEQDKQSKAVEAEEKRAERIWNNKVKRMDRMYGEKIATKRDKYTLAKEAMMCY